MIFICPNGDCRSTIADLDTIFFTQNKNDAPKRDDIIALATKIIIEEFSKKNQCLKF